MLSVGLRKCTGLVCVWNVNRYGRVGIVSYLEDDKMSEEIDKAYDKIDKFLRNSLGDTDYAEYSAALEIIYSAEPVVADSASTEPVGDPDKLAAVLPNGVVVTNVREAYEAGLKEKKREPLSEHEIGEGYRTSNQDVEKFFDFYVGVRFAERHHGIGGEE